MEIEIIPPNRMVSIFDTFERINEFLACFQKRPAAVGCSLVDAPNTRPAAAIGFSFIPSCNSLSTWVILLIVQAKCNFASEWIELGAKQYDCKQVVDSVISSNPPSSEQTNRKSILVRNMVYKWGISSSHEFHLLISCVAQVSDVMTLPFPPSYAALRSPQPRSTGKLRLWSLFFCHFGWQ